jgi:hypothetical protein
MKTILLLILFSFFFTALAQERWQLSVSAGGISPAFLVNKPYGWQTEGSIFYIFSETLIGISSGLHIWEVTYGPGGNRFTAIPLLAGGRILVPQRLYSLYFSGELGFNIIKREYTFQTYVPSERFPGLYRLDFEERREESSAKFAYRVGVGVNFSLVNNLETDFSIRYNAVEYVFVTQYSPPERFNLNLSYYSFIAGLNYRF